MKVALKYGSGVVELAAPDERVAWVRSLPSAEGGCVVDVAERLEACGFTASAADREVALCVADGTRAWAPERVLPPLWKALARARRTLVFVCTGTHDPATPENRALVRRLERLLGDAPVAGELVVHDARRARFEELGRTRRGTPLEVNARLAGCGAILVVADMKHHYFAGFSNPTKYLVPGLASAETARANHSLALEEDARAGRHPWHPDPTRRANPLAEDLLEAFQCVVGPRPHAAVVEVSAAAAGPQAAHGVLWADAGATDEVAGRAMAELARVAEVQVEPVDLLVVSAGGAPLDESLYTAQRALELSRSAVKAGGGVLFLARCPNGVGSPMARANFFEPLRGDLRRLAVDRCEPYVLYAHKPVKLARYLLGLGDLALCSELSAEDVAAIHLTPVTDPQAALDAWLGAAPRDARVGFLDDGSKLAVDALAT